MWNSRGFFGTVGLRLVKMVRAARCIIYDTRRPRPHQPKMRTKSGKVGIVELAHIERKNYVRGQISNSSAIYLHEHGGLKYEFLVRPKTNASSLFVMFSGDAIRKKYQPPVFQRWTWSKYFPGHCVYFSDPVLHLHPNIGLGWYSGTKDQDVLNTILKVTIEIAEHFQINKRHIVSYGSSGGGFASLRFINLLRGGTSICINPQIIIYKYLPKHFNRYTKICFPDMSQEDVIRDFSSRLDLTTLAEEMKNQSIIYIQNLDDIHHVEEHFKPFCACIGDMNPLESQSNLPLFHKILFNNPEGHAKGESADEFKQAMEILKTIRDNDRSL